MPAKVLTVPLLVATLVAGALPQFDAVSVRPARPDEKGLTNLSLPGRVRMTSISLRRLIGQAYALPSLSDYMSRILGVPEWGDSAGYDIEAVSTTSPTVFEKRAMLQLVLRDRFKLKVHWDTRQMPVYAVLLVNPQKFGARLLAPTQKTTCDSFVEASGEPASNAESAVRRISCGRVEGGMLPNQSNRFWFGGRRVTMDQLAASLGAMEPLDRPVINATGYQDVFDFAAEWDTLSENLWPLPSDSPRNVTLIAALREQLGLKLVARNGRVAVLVVDYVERPTPN